jgi:hypothetical protein
MYKLLDLDHKTELIIGSEETLGAQLGDNKDFSELKWVQIY